MNSKTILITGSILGLTAVVLGAFGAHGLKNFVDETSVSSFNTGVRYQMFHAIFLLLIGGVSYMNEAQKTVIYRFMLIGVLLFSGSIYVLVCDDIVGLNLSLIGFITPIGGLFLITGWVFTTYYIAKIK